MIGTPGRSDPTAKALLTPARVLPILLAVAACGGGDVPLPDLSPAAIGDTTGLVARGEYLVRTVSVCGHCHAADPQRDPNGPLSGGMAFENWRLGLIRAANLTPDSATGLGRWSEAEIVRAIRTGEDRDGDLLAPVMPYAWFHGMNDRDALAIARYLKSLAPVRHRIENEPNLIYEAAKAFFLEPEDPPGRQLGPPRGPTAEYGRYLALHVALCADCHTPRGGIQAKPDRDRLFAGGDPPSAFPANPANLTADDETGIGRWSEADFIATLRTGVNPQGDTLHPFMPWREYRDMEEADLRAIYRYLRTLEPIRNEVPRRPTP
ncbi:MAG: c-type cytochrome [Longimicrobiales bacterium]